MDDAHEDAVDRAAEEWLQARHGPDWYIGNATTAEWEAAYRAAHEERLQRALDTERRPE